MPGEGTLCGDPSSRLWPRPAHTWHAQLFDSQWQDSRCGFTIRSDLGGALVAVWWSHLSRLVGVASGTGGLPSRMNLREAPRGVAIWPAALTPAGATGSALTVAQHRAPTTREARRGKQPASLPEYPPLLRPAVVPRRTPANRVTCPPCPLQLPRIEAGLHRGPVLAALHPVGGLAVLLALHLDQLGAVGTAGRPRRRWRSPSIQFRRRSGTGTAACAAHGCRRGRRWGRAGSRARSSPGAGQGRRSRWCRRRASRSTRRGTSLSTTPACQAACRVSS